MGEHRFRSEVWEHAPGDPGSWHFLTVPAEVCEELALESGPPGGFGSIRVQARIGGTTWSTSLFPESGGDGAMVLPVKKAVRRAEDFAAGSTVEVSLAATGRLG